MSVVAFNLILALVITVWPAPKFLLDYINVNKSYLELHFTN